MEYKINDCKYDIAKFIKENICAEFGIDYWDEWLEEQDYNSLKAYPNYLVSVEEDGELIGTCAVKVKSELECYLTTFYIKKEYRNNGIGKRLFDMCMEYIETNGFKKILLSADPKFEKAMKFYEKNGFICDCFDKNYKEWFFHKDLA